MGVDVRILGPEHSSELARLAGDRANEQAWLAGAPAGVRRWGAFDGSELIGWCTAPSRATWVAGRAARFTELPDVNSGNRTDSSVEAPWHAASSATLGADEDFVQYAFPSEKEWTAGRRFAGFDIVRTKGLLVAEVSGSLEMPAEVERLTVFDDQLRWLWDRCAGAFGASAIRDAELFAWRFGPSSGRDYRVFGVRDQEGVLRGYAVYSKGPWLVRTSAVLVDWLVPPEEPEVGELLMRALAAQASADGLATVMGFLVEWSPWFERFQAAGYRVHPSPLFLVSRSAARRFDHLWLRDHWWFTLGDSVLV